MNLILRDIGRYFCVFTLLSIIYIALSWVTIFDSFMPVYYYRSIMVMIVSLVLTLLIILILTKKQILIFKLKDIILSLCLAFLFNFIFLSIVTVSFDRSISIYLISYMATHPEERFTKEDIETIFLEGYVAENHAIQRRIDEQIITGSFVDNHDGTYSISDMGQTMVAQWKFLAQAFRVNNSFLYPSDIDLHKNLKNKNNKNQQDI